MEPKNRKKIHFSVPATPGQLDPRAVERIRRRRPTPAALFRVSDHSSPEEESSPHQRSPSADNGSVSPKRSTTSCPYRPPSVKAVQRIVQSQLGAGSTDLLSDESNPDVAECDSSLSDSSDTDAQFQLPLRTGKEQPTAQKPRPKHSHRASAQLQAETPRIVRVQNTEATQETLRELSPAEPSANGKKPAPQQAAAMEEEICERRGRLPKDQQLGEAS
uniref:protein phosphatase 1 regulatory subunit 1B n=1 Tax=Pristiophorus japonicus TaxID=55135 RepID=UPI00398EFC6E